MRKSVVIVIFAALTGCGSQNTMISTPPGNTTDPDPMAVVWEQTYGMERESRPMVQWHDECRTAEQGGDKAITAYHGCITAVVYADGTIELQSAPRVSESSFVYALDQYKGWLTATSFSALDGKEMAAARDALISSGL